MAELVRASKNSLLKLLHIREIRFVLIGAFNTVFGYLIFVGLTIVIGGYTPPVAVLVISAVPSTTVAYILQRTIVWKTSGSVIRESAKFIVVTISQLGINAGLLFLMTKTLEFDSIFSQTIITFLGVIITYLAHRFWTFKNTGQKSRHKQKKS